MTYLARVAEVTLGAKPLEEMQCFKRTVCIVGATSTIVQNEHNNGFVLEQNEPMTLAKGVEHFKDMLQSMRSTIESDPTSRLDDFPIIQQILGR